MMGQVDIELLRIQRLGERNGAGYMRKRHRLCKKKDPYSARTGCRGGHVLFAGALDE
jgi:hypothetical protein